jgi:hypothetical protein
MDPHNPPASLAASLLLLATGRYLYISLSSHNANTIDKVISPGLGYISIALCVDYKTYLIRIQKSTRRLYRRRTSFSTLIVVITIVSTKNG